MVKSTCTHLDVSASLGLLQYCCVCTLMCVHTHQHWRFGLSGPSSVLMCVHTHHYWRRPKEAKTSRWECVLLPIYSNTNNVGRTLLLGLPRKQNGHPIGYIMLLSVISPLKGGVQCLRRLSYGLLIVAMLVGPLMGVKNPCKVRNWQVAKSWIFLIISLVI